MGDKEKRKNRRDNALLDTHGSGRSLKINAKSKKTKVI